MESPENLMQSQTKERFHTYKYIILSYRIDCMLIGSSSLYLLNEIVN